jgi:hypothetical protein
MHDFSRIAVALTMALASLGSPVLANSTPLYGTVLSAQRAHIGRAAATVGTAVLTGDTLDTEETGSLAVRAGGARLLLSASSRVVWAAEEEGAAATLKNGTVLFSTSNAQAFTLHASTATIRANTDVSTTASVSIISAKELTVSCVHGTLAISVEDDSKTVAEGESYRVILDPDSVAQESPTADDPATQKKPKKAGKNKFLLILFFGGAAAAAALALAFHHDGQPESPILP